LDDKSKSFEVSKFGGPMSAITKHFKGDLFETLDNVLDFLANQMDVVDGSYGMPQPNTAMALHTELSAEVDRLKRDMRQQEIASTDERKLERIIKVLKAAKPAISPKADHRALAAGILYAIQEVV